MLDAIRAYEEGVGSVGEIDEAMKAGAGHPMGPLTLADFVGLGHARLDLRRAVRRVPRAPLRAAADAAQDARRGLVRAQVGDGLLRLLGRVPERERGDLGGSGEFVLRSHASITMVIRDFAGTRARTLSQQPSTTMVIRDFAGTRARTLSQQPSTTMVIRDFAGTQAQTLSQRPSITMVVLIPAQRRSFAREPAALGPPRRG